MKNEIHSVKYNVVMNIILTVSNLLYPIITFPYVSRVLLVEANGKVNFAASVANYFMLVASLGIPTYGVRACAKVRDNRDELSKTAQEILIINFVATIMVLLTYIICVLTIPRFSSDKILFFIEGINIVLNMFGANWLYQALEQYDYITIRSVIFKCISILLMFLLVHKPSDYRQYALTIVFASVGSNILNFIRLHRYISFKRFTDYRFKYHLKPILILFAQNITVSIYTNLDTVMLGILRGNIQVGLYTAAVKCKGLLTGIVVSLGNVLLPRMSYLVKNKMKAEFEKYMILAINTVLFMSFPIVIYFIYSSKDCILLLAGNDFIGAISAMQIITFAVIPNGLTGIFGVQILTSLDREIQVLYSVIVGAVSDFILNILLIPSMGAKGAAIATTIAEFLVLFTQIILGKDIITQIYKNLKLFEYLILSIVSIIPIVILNHFYRPIAFINLVITSVIYFGLYIVILYFKKDTLLYKLLDNKITYKLIRK